MFEYEDTNDILNTVMDIFQNKKFLFLKDRYIKFTKGEEYFHLDLVNFLPVIKKNNYGYSLDYLDLIGIGKSILRKINKKYYNDHLEYFILKQVLENEIISDVTSIMKYETPDFILNCSTGVEILNYQTELLAKVDKYLLIKKEDLPKLSTMRSYFTREEFQKVKNMMIPTLDEDNDTVLAYAVGPGSYSIHSVRKKLVNEVLDKKLNKYNSGYYQIFDENYLIVKTNYSYDLHLQSEFDIVEIINVKFPNIKDVYNLKIIVINMLVITTIDLQGETITRKELY